MPDEADRASSLFILVLKGNFGLVLFFSWSGCFVSNFSEQDQPCPLVEDFQGNLGISFLLPVIFFFFLSIWAQLWK